MFNIQEELKKLPDKPGVYIMKDENKSIIYVGKAVVLKNRVRQYFQASSNHSPKVLAMVARISEFDYIVTDSELEALILECNLIKKHKPRYNIMLKDDKSYPYIKVTMNEDYPRIMLTRRMEKDGARYFGPYTSVGAVKEALDLLKKLFPIKSCSKVLPRDIGKSRPCLNYHIYQCLGPCQGGVNRDDYRQLMKDICSFLNGRQDDIVKRLEESMNKAAQKMDFERAAAFRDKILSVKYIAEKQKVLSTAMEDQDVIAVVNSETDSCVQVFFIRGGKLVGKEHFMLEGQGDTENGELIASFLKQFYSTAAYIPGEILIQDEIEESEIIEKWLSERREGRVHLRVPKRGEKLHLIEMVQQNALIALNQFKDRLAKQSSLAQDGMEALAKLLKLEELPLRIEAYDISNTGSSEMVASMVVFENGDAAPSQYRRFKIKTQDTQNDYASMQEVLYRRFRHAEKEKEETAAQEVCEGKFTKMPDLILVDGGLGHVNAAQDVLAQLGLSYPIYGMVKDDSHRTRGLVSQAGEFNLAGDLVLLRFITAIQDEAHRFAIDYNRRLRSKRHTGSELDNIEGIGPKRRKQLIKHFGSLSKIKKAGIDDLTSVEGIPESLAKKIFDYFKD